jgi:hypothetical protein
MSVNSGPISRVVIPAGAASVEALQQNLQLSIDRLVD